MAASHRSAQILWILMLILETVLVRSSRLFREVSKPAFEFKHHNVIRPYMVVGSSRAKRDINTLTRDGHLEELTLGFVAFTREFLLDLRMNKDLFPNHFVEKHHKEGVAVINKPYEKNVNHCYYNGHLRDHINSWAAISTCHSISGAIYDGSEMFFLEPTKENNTIFIYRKNDLIHQNFSCGYKDSPKFHLRLPREAGIRGPYNSNKQSRYVELVLVNDLKEYKEMKENREAVIARSKEIANIVNALYSPLNIFIALVGVEVWSEFDQITLSKDGDTTLTNFLHYRRERLVSEIPNDNAQLITGITFEGGVVGKALKGPICTYEYSGGVNMDHSPVVALVATTVAHELGHNFGMEHDNDECSCSDDRCIMAPSSSSTSPTHWSSCSLEYLHSAFEHGMDYCLRNRPIRLMGPVCGNGFVEEGEQCDCGLKKFCNNACCNASSCMLFPNATCATGECCDLTTCQVKSPATECRPIESECDLPEFCDGKREYCPDDVFKQDGVSCKLEKAYCYRGSCRSHSDQCKLLWGQSGQMSDSRCFDQNKKGTASGNCGYYRLNQTYKPCEKEDILCGMLHCTHLNERLEFGMESVAILSRSFITTGGKILTCRSAIVDLGLNSIDPGLAPDGAKCGDGKVCVNQRCMPVAALRREVCPYDCNKQGICNSKGNCHCNIGFAPPYCDVPGSGGSKDSGPASDPDANNHIATILFILFLGIIPCIIFASCSAYYYRKHLRMWSRAKEAAQRKKQARYGVDRNSLRNIEISAPMQPDLLPDLIKSESSRDSVPPLPSETTGNPQVTVGRSQSIKAAKLNLDRNSLRNLEISHPVLQMESTTSSRIIPVRPAPPRPTSPLSKVHGVNRTSTWTPATAPTRPAVVVRTSSIQEGTRSSNNSSSVRLKRLSGPSLRPTNPPPRPPPPKTSLSERQPDYAECMYEPAIYSEIYYDDCQNVALDKARLEFTKDSSPENKKDTSRTYASVGSTPSKLLLPGNYAAPITSLTNAAKENKKYSKEGNAAACSSVASTTASPSIATTLASRRESSNMSPTSLVASLAKRFEQQQSSSSSNNAFPKITPGLVSSFKQNKPHLAPKPMTGNNVK